MNDWRHDLTDRLEEAAGLVECAVLTGAVDGDDSDLLDRAACTLRAVVAESRGDDDGTLLIWVAEEVGSLAEVIERTLARCSCHDLQARADLYAVAEELFAMQVELEQLLVPRLMGAA